MSSKFLNLALFMTLFAVSSASADDWCRSDGPFENACSEVECKSASHLTFSGDLLYWRALQGGLDDYFCGETIKDQWDPGYRVGLEISPVCEGWDMGAYYTHFQNKSNRNDENDPVGSYTHFRLHYETADLVLGYSFKANDLSYTPYAGLRAVEIDQKFKALFANCFCEGEGIDSVTTLNHHEKFRGIGPKIGLKGDYNLGCHFGLFADLGAGFLYGKFDIHADDFQVIPNPTDSGAFCLSRHVNACQAFVDVAVGIQWQYAFCESLEVLVKLGLEHHRYFNQTCLGDYGDLCFDGATLSIGLEF